jgi:hypothetical protein
MTMRRREFVTAGAIAAAAAALPADGNAQRADASEDYSVGDFILRRFEGGLQIRHKNKSDRVLWETVSDGTFITAENAVADVKDFGTPMGFFSGDGDRKVDRRRGRHSIQACRCASPSALTDRTPRT